MVPDVAFELASLRLGYGLTMSNAVDKPRGVLVALSGTMNPIDDLQVLFLFQVSAYLSFHYFSLVVGI